MVVDMEGACAASSWNVQAVRTSYRETLAAGRSDGTSMATRSGDGMVRSYDGSTARARVSRSCTGVGFGRGDEQPWREGWRQAAAEWQWR
jgi:hypothetical protein